MSTDITPAVDYLGKAVNCATCPYRDLQQQRRCELQRACIQDRYAKRIDRFFAWNRELANTSLQHPYFEVRAVAAKYAHVFRLPRLLDDPDDTVRWSAAQRLPKRYLAKLRNDPSREVRIRVAARLEGPDLIPMMSDEDYYVRQTVAKRVALYLLPFMIHDSEAEVRRVVASRIGEEWLVPLMRDPAASVRIEVVQRLRPPQLSWFKHDADWRVRYEIAGRVEQHYLSDLRNDDDPLVRERVEQRLLEVASADPNQQRRLNIPLHALSNYNQKHWEHAVLRLTWG